MSDKKSDSLLLRFWGVRGSYPVPGLKTAMIGGNTSCVEIRAGEHIIIIDAGSGIINLGKQLVKEFLIKKKPIRANILFSHMHHDHTQGWPFFPPAYMGSSIFHIFGANMFGEDLEVGIYKAMTAPHFPVELRDLKSKKIFHTVTDSQLILLEDGNFKPKILNVYEDGDVQAREDQTCIRMLRGYAHPKGGIMYFRIERNGKQIVYASDTEGYKNGDVKLENFSRGADILIHDAQYTESEYDASPYSFEGFGHSTPEMAITIAKKAEVKQLILFHHHPPHDDDQILEMEKKAQKSFPNTISAYEGLEISI